MRFDRTDPTHSARVVLATAEGCQSCGLARAQHGCNQTRVLLQLDTDLIQWTPSNPATPGTSQSVLIRGMASFQGWVCTRKDTLKWPEYRGGLISGVQIRGSSPQNKGTE